MIKIQYLNLLFTMMFLFFCVGNIYAQNNRLTEADWQQILLGNIIAYQKYNVKSIKLLENDVPINTIVFKPLENILLVQSGSKNYQYHFDENNRLVQLVNKGDTHSFKYFGNENALQSQLLSYGADSLLYLQKTTFPYQQRLDISWFEQSVVRKDNHEIASVKSEGIRLHPTDSLLNYYLTINNKNYKKQYSNGNKISYKKTPDGYEYDSTSVQKNGKTFSYVEIGVGDTIKRATYLNDSTHYSATVKNKLRYKSVSNKNNIINELFYRQENEQLSKSIFYTYYPLKGIDRMIVWKVTKKDEANGNVTEDFPNKKYYSLKNGLLRLKRGIKSSTIYATCGATFNEQLFRKNFIFETTSTSILVTATNAHRFTQYLDVDNLMDGDLNMFYTKANINITEKAEVVLVNGYQVKIDDKDFKKFIAKGATRNYIYQNFKKDAFKVEMTTQDGKQIECYPFRDFEMVPISIDIVVYLDGE